MSGNREKKNGFRRWAALSKGRPRRFAPRREWGTAAIGRIYNRAEHYLWRATLIIMGVSAVFLLLSFISPPNEDPVRRDALLIMNAGMLPYAVAGYCHKEITADPALPHAIEQWNRRNAAHLVRVVDVVKATGDMRTQQKNKIQRKVLNEAKRMVESHQDQTAYCADHVRALQDGRFDLDKNPVIAGAMQGLATVDLTRRRYRDASGQWKYAE